MRHWPLFVALPRLACSALLVMAAWLAACTVQVNPQSGFDPCAPNPCQKKGACGGWTGTCTVKNNAPVCSGWKWTDTKNPAPKGADGKALTKPASYEAAEVSCDGVDNDCDGQTDEAVIGDPAKVCPAVGVCAGSKPAMLCLGGKWLCGFAGALAYEASETTCDGKDNDCDGQTDEDAQPRLGDCKHAGVCAGLAAPTCGGDKGWDCHYDAASDYEAAETKCDGLDNDCDGSVDANLAPAALAGKATCKSAGVCAQSEIVCKGGQPTCSYDKSGKYEGFEQSCDGEDNDCDGQTDNYAGSDLPLQATNSDGCLAKGVCAAKGAAVKVCKNKVYTCDYAKANGYESTETLCDGKDNDCDGSVDNIAKPPTGACGSKGVCGDGAALCSSAIWQCDWAGMETKGYEAFEQSCDGKDNDCDGQTDETTSPAKAGCKTQGVCGWGVEAKCAAAKPACDYSHVAGYQDVTETLCDGLDNDCDGKTDEPEGLDGSKSGCTLGVCAGAATASCSGGKWACDTKAAAGYEKDEKSCDGKDNDCDGLTDENLTDASSCPSLGLCSAGVTAACVGGKYLCNFAGISGYEPTELTCDGKDNDCDGKTDTGLCVLGAACNSADQCSSGFCIQISGGNSKVCAANAKQCATSDGSKVTLANDGATACASPTSVQTCSNGAVSSAVACPADKPVCAGGQCVICAPNAKTCDLKDSSKVVQCAADGLSSSPVASCGASEKCSGNGDCVPMAAFALSDTSEAAVNHEIVALSDGSFAALWTVNKAGAGELRVRLFTAAGAAKGPSTAIGSTQKPSKDAKLAAAAFGSGFAVAWEHAGDGTDIAMAYYGADGKVTVAPFIVHDPDMAGEQVTPALATYGTTAVVLWADELLDGAGYAIGLNAFDNSGKSLTQANLTANNAGTVSDATDGDQLHPTVACKSTGDCGFAYTHVASNGKGKIRARSWALAGFGSNLVTVSTAGATQDSKWPTIAWSGSSFLIAWMGEGVETGSGYGIGIRPYTQQMNVLNATAVAQANDTAAGNQAQPILRAKAGGGAMLVWAVPGLGSVREFAASAAPVGPESTYGTDATATLGLQPKIALLSDGKQVLQYLFDNKGGAPAASQGLFR